MPDQEGCPMSHTLMEWTEEHDERDNGHCSHCWRDLENNDEWDGKCQNCEPEMEE